MGEVVDLLLATTDPFVAVLIISVLVYMRFVHRDLHNDLDVVRGRVGRVENHLLATDGGRDNDG